MRFRGDWLRRAREDAGLSQRTAARRAGMPLSLLRQIEDGSGGAVVAAGNVRDLLDALNVTPPGLRARYG